MTDRDRLIELCENLILSCKSSLCDDCEHNKIDYPHCMSAHFADHLLANGVIVPPVEVGQTVYYIAGKKVYKSKCHAITQHKNGLQIHLYDYDGDNARYSTKDVFLTKEEAERKLKELNNG